MRLGLALALVLASPLLAHAQGTYDGQWRPGPQRVEVAIDSWGSDCPARPQSITSPGGAPIHITQSGDDLSFPGGHTTSTCWSDNPAVHRVSRSYSDGTWRVVCRTAAEDARSETGTYTLHATTIDTIEYREVTQYDWTLNASHCIARMTTTQTYERVSASPPPPTSTTPPPTSTAPEPACTPGAPARLVMRPASATIPPGGRACFNARVVDAAGCAIPGSGSGATYELHGAGELHGNCFTAGSATGSVTIVGHAGEMSDQATVTIETTDLSGLMAGHTADGSPIGDGGDATAGSEARVAARGEGGARGMPAWAAVASIIGLVLVLIAVAGLLVRGRRRPRPRPRESLAPLPAAAPPVPAADAAAPTTAAATTSTPAEARICPICRRGYPADVARCPRDNEPLVNYAVFVQRKDQSAPSRTCPTCGTVYPSTTRFCGKDGTTLG